MEGQVASRVVEISVITWLHTGHDRGHPIPNGSRFNRNVRGRLHKSADPCGVCRSLPPLVFLPSSTHPRRAPCLVYALLQVMIILDDSPDSQKRRLARRASSSSDVDSIGSHQMRPPSYRSVGLRYPVQPMLETEPPQSSLSLPELEKVGCHLLACQPLAKRFFFQKKKVRRRFWKGLFYALVVYAVVSIALAVPYFISHVSLPSGYELLCR